jgi:hypothetical protein
MRALLFIFLIGFVGCGVEAPPTYDPVTFRSVIEKLIFEKRFDAAVAYIKSANPEQQAIHDKKGFIAIGGYAFFIPGIENEPLPDGTRDWYMPGTSDVISNEDQEWQSEAKQFAVKYNQKRRSLEQSEQ